MKIENPTEKSFKQTFLKAQTAIYNLWKLIPRPTFWGKKLGEKYERI